MFDTVQQTRVPLSRKQVLHKAGEPIQQIYFLNDGVCSMTTVMRDGRMVEVATIGNEGLVGISALFGRETAKFLVMGLQSTACNSLHAAEERCARWLLHTRARVGDDEFPMTQALLAVMLGVRRPTVTLILQKLGQRGLIRHSRGRLAVANGAELERVSCEC